MKAVIGWLALLGYVINTIIWVTPIMILALFKLLPIASLQKSLSYLIDGCAGCWVKLNTINQSLLSPLKIEIIDMPQLSIKQWYMVICNHQSWVDIFIIQRIFSQKIPFLKFFLKQQLIFVPVIGLAWWALDFPFMKRYNREFLAKNPHLKGLDAVTTRKACHKFKHKPVSVMNFVEGTRFTSLKWQKQQSPHSNLLLPRAGGLSFAMNAMVESIDTILDVTICYPDGIPTFWQLLCGDVARVKVRVGREKITEDLIGDYQEDPMFKKHFQQWLNELWQRKQLTLEQLKSRHS